MLFKLIYSILGSGKRYRSYSRYSFKNTSHNIAVWDQQVANVLPAKFTDSDIENLFFGKVIKVIDGDTVIISVFNKPVKTRLDSIDSPEDGQEWGDIATYGLIKLIGGQTVRLEPHGLDSYGRTLVTIYALNQNKDWINVNEQMVLLGHAWVMRLFYKHLPTDRKNNLNSKENWAKSKKVGLWSNENPTPPWQWRG